MDLLKQTIDELKRSNQEERNAHKQLIEQMSQNTQKVQKTLMDE